MLQRTYQVIIFSVLIFSIGCSFEPEGEYFKEELGNPDLGNSSITLNGAENLLIYKPTLLKYKVESDFINRVGGVTVKLFFDDVEYNDFFVSPESLLDTLEIYVDPNQISDGEYEMTLLLAGQLTDGSLAGQLNLEYQQAGTWSITVDKTPPQIQIEDIAISNGELIVSWNQPDKLNFDEFYLSSNALNGPKTIKVSKTQTSVAFPYYLSGPVEFTLSVVTNSSGVRHSDPVSYDLDDEFFSIHLKDSNDVYFEIRKPRLYRNVDRISIQGHSNILPEELSDEPKGFLVESDILFGYTNSYYLTAYYSGEGLSHNYKNFNSEKIGLGNTLPLFDFVAISENENSLILKSTAGSSNITTLYKLDLSSMEIINVLEIPTRDNAIGSISISPQGDQMIYMTFTSRTLFVINVADFEITNSYNVNDSFDYNWGVWDSKLTSNKFVLLQSSGMTKVIDLESEEVVFYGPGHDLSKNGDISNDGRFLFNEGKIYEFDNISEEYLEVYTLSSDYKTGIFLDETTLIQFESTSAKVTEVSSNSLLNYFTFDEYDELISSLFYFYFFQNSQTATFTSNLASNRIDEIGIDGTVLRQLNIFDDQYRYYIVNEKLLCSCGLYLDLSQE